VLFVLLAAIAGMGCLVGAFWALRRKRMIDDLPTSRTQGVFIGLAELKGTAESESPFVSFLAGAQCVHYAWQVEEQWSRIVHESYRDSKGHMQTRTRTESGWKKVADGGESAPFYLKDDTGVLRIVPDRARIEAVKSFAETVSRDSPLYFAKCPESEIADSTHRRRFAESTLPLHASLYVVGQARERQDMVAAEVAFDKKSPMFLISTRTEKQVSSRFGLWFWVWFAIGLAVVCGVVAASNLVSLSPVPVGAYFVAAGAYLSAFLLGWVWMIYNSLIVLHHRVEQGWSQVEVQLKRRNDLIPNLVASVHGYGDYERSTQAALTALRQQAEATPPGVSGPDYQSLGLALKAVVEQYPQLKASDSFLSLQKSLSDTEQRIALARDYFNDIATFHNSRLQIVPDRWVAMLARLRPRSLMSASGFERAPVEVRLAS
jgi:hypothetical protein